MNAMPPADARMQIHSIAAGQPLDAAASPDAMGFKAYNLARLAALGLNVPPAFVLGTGFCAHPEAVTPALWRAALDRLEAATGLRLGDPRRPLLLSVRSGAPVSMPGMMETLLNIGLSETTLPGLIRSTGNPRLAWDAYRRLIAGYGEVVAGVDAAAFEADLDAVRQGRTSGNWISPLFANSRAGIWRPIGDWRDRRSRRMPACSCRRRSRPCSDPGRAPGRRPIATCAG